MRAVERTRRANSYSKKIRSVGARLCLRLGNDLLDHSRDSVRDRIGAFFAVRRRHSHADFTSSVGGHRACRNVCPAEIYANDELLSDCHARSLAECSHQNFVHLTGRKFAHAAPTSKRAPHWTVTITWATVELGNTRALAFRSERPKTKGRHGGTED